MGDESGLLPDVRDRPAPVRGPCGAVEPRQLDAVDGHLAGVREFEPGEQVKERRLPGARRPRDGLEPTAAELRVEPVEDVRLSERFAQPAHGGDDCAPLNRTWCGTWCG